MHSRLPKLPDGRSSGIRIRRTMRWDRLALLTIAAFIAVMGFHTLEQFFVHDTYAFISPESEAENHAPMIADYAAKYGIQDYTRWLVAIVDVESGGQGEDVMQSSESLGLSPNSLSTPESIDQGCSYFSSLLQKSATLGTDFDSVLQAYNYGSGYLDYVAAHGGVHTQELAETFAREQAEGKKKTYMNPVAVKANGGWRYDYGNMFYVTLVHNAVTEE